MKRVDELLDQLTLAEKIGLLHQHQAPIERLGIGGFRTGTEALHGLAWLGEATVFPQAVGLGATWDLDLIRRVGAAVGDEVRANEKAGLNVWAPVVNPLRDPRWGRNEEGYSEDAWLSGLFGQSYAEGLRGDHPDFLKTAPTLKHFLGYNNETDRCTSSSNLGPRVLHEYELRAYRPAIESGAAVAVMAAYNLVNGRPAHVTAHINEDLRSWTTDEVFVVSDAYAPSNLADPAQQAFYTDHAESHAAALKAGIDSFTDCGEDAHITIGRITEAQERGLLSEEDIDRAARRALTVRVRLGEFDPDNPYATVTVDAEEQKRLARQAAQRSIVLLKRECQLLPLSPGQRLAVVGPLADQLMTDWYSGTMPYQVTVRDGLAARTDIAFAEGVDRIALRHTNGGYLTAVGGAVTHTSEDVGGFDVFDWGGDEVLTLRAASNGRYLSVVDGALVHDSPGPHDWEVRETFRLVEQADGALLLHHELTKSYVTFDAAGLAIVGATQDSAARFHRELRRDGCAEAVAIAQDADAVIVVLGNHPLVNGRETEDRQELALPRAQEKLLRTVYAANPRTALVLTSSYPYAIGWAEVHLPAILWSAHGGQEFGHALAEVLFGEAEPAGRLPQTWYRSHSELPDLFDYDIITSDATYLYYRGTPLYPFGHGLSWTDFEYRDLRLSQDNVDTDDQITVSVDVVNVGDRKGEEVVQLYTHQQRSRVKQPLRQLRAFQRVVLAPGEQRAVTLDLNIADLSFWDVTSGRMVVETATHKVMAGRSATDLRVCTTLAVRGERIGPRRSDTIRVIDYDEYSGVELVDGDAVASAEPGAWVSFGLTDLSGRTQVTLTGGAGRLSLRADDPHEGQVLATFDDAPVPLPATGVTELYLSWETVGVTARTLEFK